MSIAWEISDKIRKLKQEEVFLVEQPNKNASVNIALLYPSPYHVAMSVEESIRELRKCSGTQFDPKIIDVFIKMIEEG